MLPFSQELIVHFQVWQSSAGEFLLPDFDPPCRPPQLVEIKTAFVRLILKVGNNIMRDSNCWLCMLQKTECMRYQARWARLQDLTNDLFRDTDIWEEKYFLLFSLTFLRNEKLLTHLQIRCLSTRPTSSRRQDVVNWYQIDTQNSVSDIFLLCLLPQLL